MKAVIVELKNNLAAVLSDDGRITTIKNKDYEIGQVIQMKRQNSNLAKKIVTFAASAAAFVILSVGTWAYASPYSYVSLDVNPSIEFTVNRFDRVLSVKAVNDDGEEILQEISLDNLENKTIEDAITNTVKQISEQGYFDGTIEGGLVITTSGKDEDKAEELAQELQNTVEEEINENGDDVVVEAYSVGLERVEEARALGVTPGKLNLVEKLQASAADPSTIDLEEWLNKPVKEIMKATKDNRKVSVATGSAIIVEDKEEQKNLREEQKAEEKEEKNLQKQARKANADAKKADDKAKAEEQKAKSDDEKAKASEKKDKASNDKVKAFDKKTNDKVNGAIQKQTEKSQKDADKKSNKIKENADKKSDKIKDDTEAKSNGKKTQGTKENAKENSQTTNDKAKDTVTKEKVNNTTQNVTDNSDAGKDTDTTDNSNNSADKDTGNTNRNQGNSNGKNK
jgi:hypothetical protein